MALLIQSKQKRICVHSALMNVFDAIFNFAFVLSTFSHRVDVA